MFVYILMSWGFLEENGYISSRSVYCGSMVLVVADTQGTGDSSVCKIKMLQDVVRYSPYVTVRCCQSTYSYVAAGKKGSCLCTETKLGLPILINIRFRSIR